VISTATPAEARRSAVAAPIPWLAPVTIATWWGASGIAL